MVYLYSTIKMMHGPINLSIEIGLKLVKLQVVNEKLPYINITSCAIAFYDILRQDFHNDEIGTTLFVLIRLAWRYHPTQACRRRPVQILSQRWLSLLDPCLYFLITFRQISGL